MTGYTANYEIPYPESADSPCDLFDQITSALNVIGATLSAIETRVSADVYCAAAKIHATNVVQDMDNYAVYETVDMDPNGIVNLIADPSTITYGQGAGIMLVGGWFAMDTISDGTNHYGVVGMQAGPDLDTTNRDTSTLGGARGSFGILTKSDTDNYAADMYLDDSSGATTNTMEEGILYVVRISDGE